MAEKLHLLDREIQYPDGHKVIIKVNSGSPIVDVTSHMKEKMKLAMAKRYNVITKALDLTKFHADPDLQDMFCALFKPVVFLAVIDIMAENIPEIEALNLYDNKLQILSHLKKMSTKLPNIKTLHMGNNKVSNILSLLIEARILANSFMPEIYLYIWHNFLIIWLYLTTLCVFFNLSSKDLQKTSYI